MNVNRACQTCHHWSEQELLQRAYTIQDRTRQIRNVAMDALMALIGDIKAARSGGAGADGLGGAQRHHRRGQFLLDFVEAENSWGFHADQESMRILSLAIDEIRQGQTALRGRN